MDVGDERMGRIQGDELGSIAPDREQRRGPFSSGDEVKPPFPPDTREDIIQNTTTESSFFNS